MAGAWFEEDRKKAAGKKKEKGIKVKSRYLMVNGLDSGHDRALAGALRCVLGNFTFCAGVQKQLTQHFYLLHGQVKDKVYKPERKSTSSGLSGHQLLCTLKRFVLL